MVNIHAQASSLPARNHALQLPKTAQKALIVVTAEERATASRRGMDVEDSDEPPRGKEMEEDPTWVEQTPAQRHKANES